MVTGSVPREILTAVLYNFINIIVYNLHESGNQLDVMKVMS